MDAAFTQTQLEQTKLVITAINAALLAFATNGAIQTYRLDTGQSVTTVTRDGIGALERSLNSSMNLCTVLEARLNGSGRQVVPGW